MTSTLRITVLTGPHRNQKFCLHGRAECLVGRGTDCLIQLAGTSRDGLISRHHCRLSLDESRLVIEDLGSLNGTFVNGKQVECAELSLPSQDATGRCQCESPSCAGSLVTVGGTTLQIDVLNCPPQNPQGTLEWKVGENVKKNCPAEC